MNGDPLSPAIQGYRVGHLLGQGGSAAVYFGRRSDGLLVAIKCLGVGQRVRGEFEEDALRTLSHENVLGCVERVTDDEGRSCLISHYVQGIALQAMLEASGPLDLVRAVEVGRDIARALGAVAAHGLIHRDVKPGNVMIGRTPTQPGYEQSPRRTILIDFGLVLDQSRDDRLTRTGEPLGTPRYCAPEQVEAVGVVGPAADVYGLGMTILAMLVGAEARYLTSPEAALGRARQRDVDEDLLALLELCVKERPDERPAVDRVARTLEAIRARFDMRPRRRLHPGLVFFGGALSMVVGGLVVRGLTAPAAWEPRITVRDPRALAGVTPNLQCTGTALQWDTQQCDFAEDFEREVECSEEPIAVARLRFGATRQTWTDGVSSRTFVLRAEARVNCGDYQHGDPTTPRSAYVFPNVFVPVVLRPEGEDGGSWEVSVLTTLSFTRSPVRFDRVGDRFVPHPEPEVGGMAPGQGLVARIGATSWPITASSQRFSAVVSDDVVDVELQLGRRPEGPGGPRAPLVGTGCLGWAGGEHTPLRSAATVEFTISVQRVPTP